MAEVKLTNAQFARHCASMAREASAWSADLLALDEYHHEPARPDVVARFTDDLRRRLQYIDACAGRALLRAEANQDGEGR